MITTSNHESNRSGIVSQNNVNKNFSPYCAALYGTTGYQVYSNSRISLVIRQMSPNPIQRPKQIINNYSQVVSVQPKSIIVQFIPP